MAEDDNWPQKPTWDNEVNQAETSTFIDSIKRVQKQVVVEEAENEKECSICFDAEHSVIFSPCGHGACTDCVTRMRRDVIYKADKGMRCPFCRQSIESHKTAGTTGGSKAKQALQAVSHHQKQAALAQVPEQSQKRISSGAHTPSTNMSQWQCMKCKDQNLMTEKMCTRCRHVAPSFVLQQIANVRGNQDIMKVSNDTICQWARVKLHPNFNAAFAEAGIPFDMVTATLGGEDEQSVLAAIKGGHCKKLKRILEALIGNSDCKELATDFYGNYTLQDLIEITAKLRQNAKSLLSRNAISKAMHDEALGIDKKGPDGKGADYLRRITLQLQVIAATSLIHPQANYVIAKILDHGDELDCIIITTPIFMDPYRLLTPDVKHSKFAIIKAVKAVDKLVKYSFEPGPHKDNCAKHLDKFCAQLLKETYKFDTLLRHDLAGPMILDAAQGGLPHDSASQVLTQVARDVNNLRTHPAGVSVLRKFMTLESRNAECREIFITDVCIMAAQLSPNYAETANPRYCGPELIQRMLELLSQEQEPICDDWVRHITSLLTKQASTLVTSSGSKDLLIYSLDLPAVADEVPKHLEEIKKSCGHHTWQSIRAALTPSSEDQSRPISASLSPALSAHASQEAPALAAQPQEGNPQPQEEDLTGFTVVQGGRSKKKGKKAQNNEAPPGGGPAGAKSRSPRANTDSNFGNVPETGKHAQAHLGPKAAAASQTTAKKGAGQPASAKKGSSPVSEPPRAVSNSLYTHGPTSQPPGTGPRPSQVPQHAQQPGKRSEDDDNFLADLLPGLVIGGSASNKTVAAPKSHAQPKMSQGPPPAAFAATNGHQGSQPVPFQAAPYTHFSGTAPLQAPASAQMNLGLGQSFGGYHPMGAMRPASQIGPPPGVFFGQMSSGMETNQPSFFTPPIQPPAAASPPQHIAVTPFAPDGHKHVKPAQRRSSEGGTLNAVPASLPVRKSDEVSPAPVATAAPAVRPAAATTRQTSGVPGYAPISGKTQPKPAQPAREDNSAFGGVRSQFPQTPTPPVSYGETVQGKTQEASLEPSWICTTCGYKHEDNEARFLTCALCYQERQS